MSLSTETPTKENILSPRDVNVVVTNDFSSPKLTSLSTSTMTPTLERGSDDMKTPGPDRARYGAAGTTPGTVGRTPGTAGRKTPGRGLFSPCLPLKQRQLGIEERRQKFESVCKMRVGEDHDDDLYEAFGIEEWSIDDFEYVRKLGNGGLANVYLAHEIQSGHPVALKVQHAQDSAFCELDIHQELSDGMKDCRDVDNTSNSILKLIGYFYSNEKFGPEDDDVPGEGDLGECDGHVYLYTILEFCEGGDLHDAIDLHGEVPEELAAKYMACAIRALEHLHSKSIIHCDVKPSNFLLCKDDNVKLADFGMSVRSTEKEIVGGSPVYMAPEHLMAWRHHSDDFDHRVDIYSLGVVMYELLMGYLPYDVIEAPRDENGYLISSRTQGSSDPDDDSDKDDYELDSVFPVLDLRNFKDSACTEPIVVPAPVFMDEISEEAEDLIHHFLESDKDRRITLAEAKQHKWFKKFALEYDTECMDG